jgi:hypothetical protein
MTPQPRLTEGEYVESPTTDALRDEAIDVMKLEIAHLNQELRRAKFEVQQAHHQQDIVLANLRQTLSPLYQALRGVFGELDHLQPEAERLNDATRAGYDNSAWESWKRKLGGKQAEFIQVLCDHGPMSRDQLRIVTKSGWSTVDITLGKLRQLQLVYKEGNRWTLKSLTA